MSDQPPTWRPAVPGQMRPAASDEGPPLGLGRSGQGQAAPTAAAPVLALPTEGPPTFPYLPPITQGDQVNYHHQVIIRPPQGEEWATAHILRFAWQTDPKTLKAKLVQLEPLDVKGKVAQPVLVLAPPGCDSDLPQCWVVKETTAQEVLIGAIPRRSGLPLLQIIPGEFPPPNLGDHVMTLPPRIDLPEMRYILPCKLQIFPITDTCGIAVRFRMSNQGVPVGVTPYLFRATLTGPRSWNLLSGRRILEENPITGETRELVEATPQSGQLAPLVTVFQGRCLATFSWRASPNSPCFNLAGLVPEARPPDVAEDHSIKLTQF